MTSNPISTEAAEPNNAALLDARRRTTGSTTQFLENIVQGSNCMRMTPILRDA